MTYNIDRVVRCSSGHNKQILQLNCHVATVGKKEKTFMFYYYCLICGICNEPLFNMRKEPYWMEHFHSKRQLKKHQARILKKGIPDGRI